MSAPRPKAGVLDIAPYVPGRARAAGVVRPIKLSANENALGCSPLALEAYRRASESLNLYPDPRSGVLRAALAGRYGLEQERLIFGCGSDDLFSLVCNAFLSPGDVMIQPAHGFAAWAIAARAAGAEVIDAPERDLTVDVDAILARIDARTKMVFVANPANPTGTVLPFAEIARLHAGLPSHVVLVLDGAYAEFAGADFDAGLDLARASANVFVTRTFSKLHGLAALRIGWGYAAEGLVAAMDRIRPPFNTSAPAQAAAVAALADAAFAEASAAHVEAWRPRLSTALADAGLRPVPSATNFVTARVAGDTGAEASALVEALARRGLLIRGLAGYGLPDAVRITIGTDGQMEALLAALPETLAALGG